MKKRLLFAFYVGLFSGKAAGQDPVFSQFFAAGIQMNPAFAGSAFAPRFGLNYRHQWPGFGGAYTTYSASYEQSIESINSGIGFTALGDNQGDGIFKTNRFGAIYAYQLPLSEDLFIKIGFEAAMHQANLNWDKLIFTDQIEAIEGNVLSSEETRPDVTNRTSFDATTGFLIYGEKLYAGLSLRHLNTPATTLLPAGNLASDQAFLPMRISLHGGAEFIIQKGNKVRPASFWSPNLLFEKQGEFKQLNVGAYVGIGPMFGGLWFRHTFGNADATILLVGIKQGVFKLGLSYDTTVSGLSGYTGGSYEVSLGILLDQDSGLQKKRQRNRLNDCLHMFR